MALMYTNASIKRKVSLALPISGFGTETVVVFDGKFLFEILRFPAIWYWYKENYASVNLTLRR